MRNLNLIKFIYILIMDKKNDDFMTINNLKQLIKIFNKFMIDTHGINIESENIDLKKIMFPIMQKIIKTKYGNQLNVRELNKITLKSTRDNIYETNKELFTNEKKFGTIHRENQIHNNRKTHENIDFKESNRPELKREIANDINNNFNELQNQRNNTNNIPTQVEFEEKMKDTELTLEDMDLKMKALEDSRNKQNTDIITNMKNNNELVTNDDLVPSQQINNTNMEPINFNRIPEENERNNLLDNMNNHINDNLNNNTLDGFNLDDNFNDFSLDLTNNRNNNQNYVIDNNQNVINLQEKPQQHLQHPQEQMIHPQEQMIQPQQHLQHPQEQMIQPQQHLQHPQEQMIQPQEQMIHQTILKKIIICSKDRDMEEFPLPNKYKIRLEQPMRYIKRIKLVNILINFKKERKKKNIDKTDDEIENFNYAILNLNNYDVNKSNNSKINNSFAFIYPNKVYDEEIFFENELDVLEEINIELLNHNGDFLKIKDNHIIELQLEVF